eukprot:12760050-Alexandrium_andersonii.AAC.1
MHSCTKFALVCPFGCARVFEKARSRAHRCRYCVALERKGVANGCRCGRAVAVAFEIAHSNA